MNIDAKQPRAYGVVRDVMRLIVSPQIILHVTVLQVRRAHAPIFVI